MKKIIAAFALSVLVLSCATGKQGKEEPLGNENNTLEHGSRGALDWSGLYSGTIPSADSHGIDVQIALNKNETFIVKYHYLGKDDVFVFTGNFSWDDQGSMIILDSDTLPRYYKVREGSLLQMDMQGNVITGEFAGSYILEKTTEAAHNRHPTSAL